MLTKQEPMSWSLLQNNEKSILIQLITNLLSIKERKERKLIVGTVRAVRDSTWNYYLIKSNTFNTHWVYN